MQLRKPRIKPPVMMAGISGAKISASTLDVYKRQLYLTFDQEIFAKLFQSAVLQAECSIRKRDTCTLNGYFGIPSSEQLRGNVSLYLDVYKRDYLKCSGAGAAPGSFPWRRSAAHRLRALEQEHRQLSLIHI